MQEFEECIEYIGKAKKIAIITHENADADAICSAIALKRLIKKHYENNTKHIHIDIFTDTKEFGEVYEPLVKNVPINNKRYKVYDMAIALDCPNVSRLGKYKLLYLLTRKKIMIDHHETCTNFGKVNVHYKTSSTCEILYLMFILKGGWETSPEIVRLIYTGMITDTNNLTQNVSLSTHKVIANMMQRDFGEPLNLETIRNYFFKNSTKEKISLLQRALNSLDFYEKDRIAIMKIVKQDLIETDCTMEDTLGIVDYAISMKGVDIGVIFIKQEDNSYYVSLRSKDDIDVSSIATAFGGGGHLNIAAFSSSLPLADLRQDLINKCKEELLKHPTGGIIGDLFDEDV